MVRNIFLVFIVGLFFSGCAGGSSSNEIMAFQPVDGIDKTVMVVVYSENERAQKRIPEVENALVSGLNLRGTFKRAATDLETSDFTLEVEILDTKNVGDSSRVMLGALAGRAKITLRAKFFERGNETPLGIIETQGKSSGGTVFAGTNDQAAQNAVQEILQWIRARK